MEEAPPPPPPYLRSFLQLQNYARPCSNTYYCFRCERSICAHCCGGQHATRHHPQERPAVAQVRLLGLSAAISAEDVKGVGYDWRHIQRIKHGGGKYILLNRLPAPPGHNRPQQCSHCGDAMTCRALFCCAACKVENVLTGRGREMFQTLVATPFGDAHLVDTFCTTCRRSFSSVSCVQHILMHHGNDLDAQLVRIARHAGWILTRRNNGLPEDVVHNVQEIDVDGVMMIPIFRRDEPADGEAGRACINCMQIIGGMSAYCSLWCKNEHTWKLRL